jgi:glycosyltransferase involved in cell wall biosynthesis
VSQMRVALDGRSLASAKVPRGWDRFTLGLARELSRRGIEIALLCRQEQATHASLTALTGCRVLPVPAKSGVHWEQVALPRVLREHRFDIYHATNEHGVPLWSPCPVVLTVHSVTAHSYHALVRSGMLPPPVDRYLGGPFRRATARYTYWRAQVLRADHLTVPSSFCREEVMRHLRTPGTRVTVTPLAPAAEFAAPVAAAHVRSALRRRLEIRQPYVLCVGGYEPHKNVEGTLAAFAAARRETDLQFVAVGTGAVPQRIVRAAMQLGLRAPRDVVFLSDIGSDLVSIFDDAAAFVTMSWRESFGLPALEALCRGVPVIASQWGAAFEVLGDAATLVDPTDTVAAARTIVATCFGSRPEHRGPDPVVLSRFSWAKTADAVMDLYRSLINGRSPSTAAVGSAERAESSWLA